MARRKPATSDKNIPSFSGETEEEEAQWLAWFEQVKARKKALVDARSQPFVVSEFEKDGKIVRIARQKSRPLPVAAILKVERKKEGGDPDSDMESIRILWEHAADAEIVSESSIYSFRKGVLTISVFNASLYQEIRQFHREAILKDMREGWTIRTPLLNIQYRYDKR